MTKRLLLAALVLFAPCFAYADGGCANDVATRVQNNLLSPIAGASALVCTNATCNVHATLYQDSTLGVTVANPVTADARGNYSFCALPGQYTVKVTNPANATTYTIPQVTVPVALDGVLSVKSINSVRYADQYTGANAGEKIAAAIADLPASGGVVDARGFGAGSQTVSSTVSIGSSTKPVVILFNPATSFQPATTGLTMFAVKNQGRIVSLWVDLSNTFTGRVVSFTDDYRDGTFTGIDGLRITASANTTGTGIYMAASTTGGIDSSLDFISIKNVRTYGLQYGIYMTASGTAWLNGNHFEDIEISHPVIGIRLYNTTSSSAIDGNLFSNVTIQKGANTTQGILMGGTAGTVAYNVFSNLVIWDTSAVPPIEIDNSAAVGNLFIGRWDGTFTDTFSGNNFIDIKNGTSTFNGMSQFATSATFGSANLAANRFEITPGTTAPIRRGITYDTLPNGDITFWVNSNLSNPNFVFKDGNGGATKASIDGLTGKGTFKGGFDTGTLVTGTAPIITSSTTINTNFNADMVDGLHAASFSQATSCGTTTTCSNTVITSPRIVRGTVALSSGTPSTATVASITAFTSTTSYTCTLTNQTNAANNILKVVNTSTTSFTITGPNTITDVIGYICVGN